MNKEQAKLYNYFGMTEREWEQADALCDLICPEPEDEEIEDDRTEQIIR